MDIIEKGSALLAETLGDDVDVASIPGALRDLLTNEEGDLDIGALLSGLMESGGLKDMLGSMMGGEGSFELSMDQVTEMFGEDQISGFAEKLGVDPEQGKAALAKVLPDLAEGDFNPSDMLESVGGIGGLFNTVKGFFK